MDGLDGSRAPTDDSVRMRVTLAVILDGVQPVKLVSTVLPLHSRPKEPGWLEAVTEELLPRVAEAKLATFCDAFVEQSAFTADEARRVMAVARSVAA